MLTVAIPSIVHAQAGVEAVAEDAEAPEIFHRYPAIDDAIVAEIVGAAHFDLERVRELVERRPELARATWDWGFGDWETAIGAASHVGRRDIVDYLLSRGARPDIFSLAMMGAAAQVRGVLAAFPEMASIDGPHGISLLQHARLGLRDQVLSDEQRVAAQELVDHLESLRGDAKPAYLEVAETEQDKFIGDYKYGDGEKDGFSVRLNMRKLLSLGKIGTFGGALFQLEKNVFTYNGCPSVKIEFHVEHGSVLSLTIHEPQLTLVAKKI